MYLHTHEYAHANILTQKVLLNPHIAARTSVTAIPEAETGRSPLNGSREYIVKLNYPNKTGVRFPLTRYTILWKFEEEQVCTYVSLLTLLTLLTFRLNNLWRLTTTLTI